MTLDLPLIWAGIIVFSIIMYVVMDGFDLGIGILFPLFPKEEHRDTMMNSIAPVWDGNETWLVLGGVGLLAAFPLAYAVILPALYLPLIVMLIALIFRGVAFEFRFKSRRTRALWDLAFSGGSLVAAFVQGAALGAFIQGFEVANRGYVGNAFHWLTPFALFTGVALVAGYAALGCAWLILKTRGDLQDGLFRLMFPLAALIIIGIGIVSLWTPLLYPQIAARWFSFPNLLYLSPVPLCVLAAALALLRAVRRRAERAPFLLTLALFLLSFLGLGVSLWPNIVPPSISIWEAAAGASSQSFLLVGVVVLLPIILAYTAHNYWVFRGKVSGGYH
jgi:cytochrome d ubiquinol oxidase subunit II